MVISDRSGLPIAARIASGPRNEIKLIDETIDSRFVRALPRRLIGDSAYDSNEVDRRLRRRRIELIAPNNPTHKKSQDGRQMRRYRRRWHVERLFAWLLRNRRVHTRYERKPGNFFGFLCLACLKILLRRL
jgi:transposase